jgi:hypothetical protein
VKKTFPVDAEGLLRHRVHGIIAAAEGRAEHLLAGAAREADEARREATLEALDAVADAERELRLALGRLSATAARLATSLDASACDGQPAGRPRLPRDDAPRRRTGRFSRASMRDRPVAALFAAAAEPQAEDPGVGDPHPPGRHPG